MSALSLDFDCVSVIVGLLLSDEGATLETLSTLSDFGPDWAEGVADLTENRPFCCVNRTVNEAFTVRSLADAVLLANWLVSGGRWQKTDSTAVYTPENVPEAELAGLNFVQLSECPIQAGMNPPEGARFDGLDHFEQAQIDHMRAIGIL